MAEPIVSFFVQNLGEQLLHELDLLSGVRNDVQWIKDELQSMRAFLKDADQRGERDKGVEAWITQVRHLVFNAEDAVDEFMIRTESQRRLRNGPVGCLVFHACFIKHLIVQHRFGTQIQKIRKEVTEIQERSARYRFQDAYQEGSSSNATVAGNRDPGVAAPWVEEADIVGLKNDAMELEQLLENDETQQRTVISIVGMGGSGKTTLAKKVYKAFHLKYCFLYCGLFPEDHVIMRKKLIRMWVAEGFIEEHPRKTPEEVSSNYFAQLIDRNLLQPVIHHYTGELKACQVHDLMRDIAIHMFKKENFAAILTNRGNNFEEVQRRLAIQNTAIHIPGSMSELNPRSLLVFNDQEFPSSSFCRMFSKFKLLRVLDLEGTKIKILPNEVGGLIHLRYLSLRRTQIEELPVSLQRLHNLQTLDVRDSQLKGLPTGIEMLTKLRHLNLKKYSDNRVFYKMPKQTANLSNLQTLSGASVDGGFTRELGYLTQLKKLSIGEVKGEHCRQLCDSISQLKWLRSLQIEALGNDEELNLQELSQPPQYLEKLYLVCVMKEFPQWIGSQNCLRSIVLTKSQFVKDPLVTLGQLPNLVCLRLNNVYVGKQIYCESGGFPKLRTMAIIGMEELEEWSRIEEGTMKSLQYLAIDSCPKLKMLPDGFQHLAAIQQLRFSGMSEEFMKRVRRGGDDVLKVRHIAEIRTFRKVGGEYITELL